MYRRVMDAYGSRMDEIEGTELQRRRFRELVEWLDPLPPDDDDEDVDTVGC